MKIQREKDSVHDWENARDNGKTCAVLVESPQDAELLSLIRAHVTKMEAPANEFL